MNKILAFIFLSLFFCNTSFAGSYYFKNCKINNAVTADYIIDLKQGVIKVNLKVIDGTFQNFSDKIKSIEKNKIISEKIKSQKGKDIYYQYFLNLKTKSVTKLQYMKEIGTDINVFNLYEKRATLCKNVKGGWDKRKIDKAKVSKEQKQILKAQEKIKREQSELAECRGEDYNQWTDCKGFYTASSGQKYNGLFIDGQIIKGFSVYPGGAKYVGEFKNYKPHGYGTFVWKNGNKYYGQWRDGVSNGNGTKIWKDGRKYLGTFKNDKLHGEGTLFYPDGKKYVGEFINGKRHGEGMFTYSDGSAYIGKFIAGVEDGIGDCVDQSGVSTKCKNEKDAQLQNFAGKNTLNISIVSKKWVRISQYESNTKRGKKIMDKLKNDFEVKASELCASKGKVNVLQKKIEVLDMDDTPAYGLETKLKIGIKGVIECV